MKKGSLDTSAEKLPFRKGRVTETPHVRPFSFSRIFGAFKGTVTIMPGVDLTRSTGETWDAEK